MFAIKTKKFHMFCFVFFSEKFIFGLFIGFFQFLFSEYNICKLRKQRKSVVMLVWHFGFLILILLIMMIVVGNVIVFIAVLIDRELRRLATNKFIASLAISDLLVGTVVMPLSLYATVINFFFLKFFVDFEKKIRNSFEKKSIWQNLINYFFCKKKNKNKFNEFAFCFNCTIFFIL